MSYEERIRRERPLMSRSFGKLADFLLDSYIEASFMTASELAHALDLDAATVVRFSQNLGYTGYPKLQREIRQRVKDNLLLRPDQIAIPDSVAGLVDVAMQELIRAIEQVRFSLDTDSMERLFEHMAQARRIIILAEAPAQPIAYNLVYFLEQGGFPIYIARPGVADLARTIHTASNQDLLMAIDVSGQSPYITGALTQASQKGIPTAAIVGAGSIPSARPADIVLESVAHPEIGVGIITIEAIVYALVQVMRVKFADRFAGAEQAIVDLSNRIHTSSDKNP